MSEKKKIKRDVYLGHRGESKCETVVITLFGLVIFCFLGVLCWVWFVFRDRKKYGHLDYDEFCEMWLNGADDWDDVFVR